MSYRGGGWIMFVLGWNMARFCPMMQNKMEHRGGVRIDCLGGWNMGRCCPHDGTQDGTQGWSPDFGGTSYGTWAVVAPK
eukprot:4690593-Heterocapsa_arctica.AAC.1